MEANKLRLILTFIIKLISALGIAALGIIILLNSSVLGEGTAASLITIIVAALGVSIGYTAKNDKVPPKEIK